MKRALITGITGFVGPHLAEYLLKQGYEVYGTVRWRSNPETLAEIRDRIKIVSSDLKDAHNVNTCLQKVEPDEIYHLAAQSFVPTSFEAPNETLINNIATTANILEAMRLLSNKPKMQMAGSSEEYGLVYPDEVPIRETNPLRPLSPYGVSKVACDKLTLQYHHSYGLKTVVTRAFNHEGPKRGEVFVTSNFAKQIAEIEAGRKKPVIYVGNLEAQRDYSDVRDIVKAYHLSLQKCDPGEVYNICSERSWKIKDVLAYLLSLSKVKVDIEKDPTRMRPSDVEVLKGDCTKFREKTGWKPEIAFEKTLEDTLKYWREKIK